MYVWTLVWLGPWSIARMLAKTWAVLDSAEFVRFVLDSGEDVGLVLDSGEDMGCVLANAELCLGLRQSHGPLLNLW